MIHQINERLARIFYPYGSVRKVRRGPMAGYSYFVSPGMGFSYAWGRENMNLSWFEKNVKPGMCIYDVGANRGQISLYFARKVGQNGLVVSFEPVPDVYKLLAANVKLNGLTHVVTHCAAAADHDGFMTFEFDPVYSTQGKLGECEPEYKVATAKELKVKSIAIDGVVEFGTRPPDLMKIDVEGGAALVLKGAEKIIAKYRPKIYCELHGPEEKAAIKKMAETYKYRISDISGREIENYDLSKEQAMCCEPM